ncbi:MAG: hypothetical protein AUJ85_02385 [Elusimicrobia bacterium CG1_02_37_114]|nr:MAG: hypothetical protein AUJ85_02385 [Elusimicrobia bacterium CG1_02_37_114]
MKKLPDNQIAFYQSPDGSVNIEVLYAEENIWLTQKKMAELFDTTVQNITQHLKNIYTEGESDQTATCKDFLQVQKEGEREVKRNTSFYSLEAIIAVGYRVNSERGTQFRQWATEILKNFILPSPEKQQRKLFKAVLVSRKIRWGLRHGEDLRTAKSCPAMWLLLKIIELKKNDL